MDLLSHVHSGYSLFSSRLLYATLQRSAEMKERVASPASVTSARRGMVLRCGQRCISCVGGVMLVVSMQK